MAAFGWAEDLAARRRPVLLPGVEQWRRAGRLQLYRDGALILRVQKLGESDPIITLLTRWFGKVRAAAKGSGGPHRVRCAAGAVRSRGRPDRR